MNQRYEGLIIGVASPGDVDEERAAVKAACERLNRTLAPRLGCTLAVVMWEDQASGSGRPQGLINERLDKAHILIGIMHRKWGSPTGKYSSGFEEEFERARARRASGGHPEIKMYFKKVDAASIEDAGPQLTKVLAFKKSLRDANDLLYGEFETAGHLEQVVYDALVLWLIDRASPTEEAHDGSREEEVKYRLARAITELPESDRVLLALTCYEGLTTAEIGVALAIDEPQAAEEVADALQRLSEYLADDALASELEQLLAQHQPNRSSTADPKSAAAHDKLADEPARAVPAQQPDPPLASPAAPPALSGSQAPARPGEPPAASAVEQLKAWLPDTVNHIRIQDLIETEADKIRVLVRQLPIHLVGLDAAALQDRTAELLKMTRPLLELVCNGIRYDRDLSHADTWVAGLQALLTARPRPVPGKPYQESLERLRHYPALLYLRAAGTVALARDRDEILIRLMTVPTWRAPMLADSRISASQALHEYRLFDRPTLLAYPRFTARWHFPSSVLLREDLQNVIVPFLTDADEYERACDDYEYRAALITHMTRSEPGAYEAAPGNFIGERRWEWGQGGRPHAEIEFQARADRADDTWPWWQVVGGRSDMPSVLVVLREHLREMRRFF